LGPPCAAYQCSKLIYYEHYSDADQTFGRETQLKNWSRRKKIELIDRLNPSWLDLGSELLEDR
jgi:putative endonuclease